MERSINAWQSIRYSGRLHKAGPISDNANVLRNLGSLEAVLECGLFWFFQTKKAFERQNRFAKWDPNRLDEYVLLPTDDGFVNNRDCFFISHYWRTPEHPDPEGEDLRLNQTDLEDAEYSYVWVDWTCMPQAPRNEPQQKYFKGMLRLVPMVVSNCGFQWRYPEFEPRAWILFEVAEYTLNHVLMGETDDLRPFKSHVFEMVEKGVSYVVERYGYKCTDKDDLPLVIHWLEIFVILHKVVHDLITRRDILYLFSKPTFGKIVHVGLGIEIDKVRGVVSAQGNTYRFSTLPPPDGAPMQNVTVLPNASIY